MFMQIDEEYHFCYDLPFGFYLDTYMAAFILGHMYVFKHGMFH